MRFIKKGKKLKQTRICIVGVVRDHLDTNKVLYSTGKILCTSKEQYRLIKRKLQDEFPHMYIYRVYLKDAKSPSFFKISDDEMNTAKKDKKTYCPYCGRLEIWKKGICPVCGISDNEFWVKAYNDVWKNGVENAPKR